MSKVLMLSLVFGPDTVSTANFMSDIAHGLRERGHEVTVLTSMPHYNPSETVRSNPVYRSKRVFTESYENGVRVLRVYMPLKGNKVWLRALDYLWFHLATTLVALLKIESQDVVFVPSPPITLGVAGYFLAISLGAKLVYDVRELWPDVLVQMGLLGNKLILRLAYALESFVYKRSVLITSIARSFSQSLIKRGVPASKLRFTPNFVDVAWLQPRAKENDFARAHGLNYKFVAFYAGNIGLTQGLEILVPVAQSLERETGLVLLVVGDGAGRPGLEKSIRDAHLTNILFLPFQPYARIPDTYATADVCLSPMRFGFSYNTVPSKIYTAMAAGRPVIAASEPDTETADLINETGGGLIVTPESAEEMAEAIQQLRANAERTRRMGERARKWIVDYYSKSAVLETYDQVMRQATESVRK